jgi:hypothetical protein
MASLPFAAGKRWLYDFHTKNSASGPTGVSQTESEGQRLLYVDGEVNWQGRSAWQITQYDRPTKPQTAGNFVATTLYVVQDADGLERWVPTAVGGDWKRILSAKEASFSAGAFLMAGMPAQGDGLQQSGPTPITVAAGSFSTVDVSHEASLTGQYAPSDIFEKRHEYYADNVGLVSAAWSYSVDNNDPQATDTSSTGSLSLNSIDSGPNVLTEAEPNDVGSELGAESLSLGNILTGGIELSDSAMVVTDSYLTSGIAPNVLSNENGKKAVQDWFKFKTLDVGMHHIVLKYSADSGAADHPNALALYLFRSEPGVGLKFEASSVLDSKQLATNAGEWIHADNLPAGTYIVAVQALSTPGGAVGYWLSAQ